MSKITEDKWDDMYGDEDHGRPSVGGKLGSKGQLMGKKGKPVGSRTDQARSELPRYNRTRNAVKEDAVNEAIPNTSSAKAWVKDFMRTKKKHLSGKSAEDKKKIAA